MDDERLQGTRGNGGTESRPASSVSIDRDVLNRNHVFGAIDHPRRRYLLYALATDSEWTLGELATTLVAWERDVAETAVRDDRRDEMLISLFHAHVPKLVEEGVIRFDDETETIARGEHAEAAFTALRKVGAFVDGNH